MQRKSLTPLVALLALTLLSAACSGSDSDSGSVPESTPESTEPLTIYSGRSEELVGPVLALFTEETGIEVEVRYGDTAEMAALILEEGDNSPADVFFGQDAGALGALSAAGSLAALPDSLVSLVPDAFRSSEGEWVGVSGRARVAVYNTELLTEADLPESILDFTAPEWKGRIGWAPSNGSFQAFVTALRVLVGEEEAKAWLEGIVANDPAVFDGNGALVEAVAAGEVEVGFVNHYYLLEFKATDPEFAAANKYFDNGDPGGLVNVAGAGVLGTTDQTELALRFVEFLLSASAQTYFAETTFEIPMIEGIEQSPEVPDLGAITIPEIDLNQLEDLAGTLALLTEVGAL